MQRFLAIIAHWFHTLAFAVWLGGIFAIGALVAPSAFGVDRTFAGQVMTASFQKLNTLSFVCAAVMLAATWAEWRARGEPARKLLFVRAVLTAAAVALALFLALRLLPSLIGMRGASQKAAFDRLHQFSAIIFQVQTFLLLAGGAITSYLAFSPMATGVGRPSAPESEKPARPPNTRTPESALSSGGTRKTGAKRP